KCSIFKMNFREMCTRLQNFQVATGYDLNYSGTYRIFEIRGFWRVPCAESEVFVSGIPFDALEDELMPFFATVGSVVKFKLLTFDNTMLNKGFAVVTYSDSRVAQTAINVLNFVHFRGALLSIEKVTSNCRLFIGGIPENKSKDQVWHALVRNGIHNVVDVIMYRSYRNRTFNRGYVFVEFPSYLEAAQTRVLHRNLSLWGERVSIDWSEPIPSVTDDVMSKVKKLFIRNIEVTMTRNSFESIIIDILGNVQPEKVYKFKDYAFVHFRKRSEALTALRLLKGK
ncbi:RNA binding protein, partial [Oryctes borbonicus]